MLDSLTATGSLTFQEHLGLYLDLLENSFPGTHIMRSAAEWFSGGIVVTSEFNRSPEKETRVAFADAWTVTDEAFASLAKAHRTYDDTRRILRFELPGDIIRTDQIRNWLGERILLKEDCHWFEIPLIKNIPSYS